MRSPDALTCPPEAPIYSPERTSAGTEGPFGPVQKKSARIATPIMLTLIAFLGLCVLGPAAAPAQSVVVWTQQMVSGPSPREEHAMAYDSARGVTVLFGGLTGSGYPGQPGGDTWEWDGASWAQRAVGGPAPVPRYDLAMAYDAARGVMVLFGGHAGTTNFGDTWEWNGSGGGTWTQRLVAGPSARYGHAMVYDAARGVTLLFGGDTGVGIGLIGDTWEWNGTAWVQRPVSGPSPRWGHVMAYDAARGVTVLFGGNSTTDWNDETWEWGGTVWSVRAVSGPSRRPLSAMAFDQARGVTVLFGGLVNSNFPGIGDTWEWRGTTWVQRLGSGPSPRWGPAMVYDAARGLTVLYGGRTSNGHNGETWLLGSPCGSPDFNHDGTPGTDADIEAFFACLAGNCCATCDPHGADFNGDGDTATDADIEAFFRVLAGGTC